MAAGPVCSKVRVACLISGGVDSLIASHLLKRWPSKFDLLGVHLTCWKDDNDGTRSELTQCNKDFEDAKGIAKFLGIDLYHLDLSKQYWNEVFCNFLESYQNGETPNPDILCNRYIKFKAVIDHVKTILGCDAIATGHYAGTSFGNNWQYYDAKQNAKLMRAWNKSLDQTFFLSQVPQEGIRSTIFPLQYYSKTECRTLARELKLSNIADRHKSDGICFIGPKKFPTFIENYLPRSPGPLVDLDSGEVIGEHKGFHFWTIGQRTRMEAKCKYYVIEKIKETNTITLSSNSNHPVLFKNTFKIKDLNWIDQTPIFDGKFACQYKFQQLDNIEGCYIERYTQVDCQECLKVTIDVPKRALTLGQYCVLYKNEECIGSGRIFELD